MYIISIVSTFAMDDTNFGIKSQTPPPLCVGVQSYFVFIVVPCLTHVSIAIFVNYIYYFLYLHNYFILCDEYCNFGNV